MADHDRSSDEAIQRLVDIHEITQLKARYCRFVDTKDWAGFAGLLTDDFHMASDGRVHDGRDAVVAFVSTALASAMTIHHVHTPEVTFTGSDTASAIWPMNDYVVLPGDGGDFVLRGWGYYHDDYVRTAEGWRLQRCVERRLRVDVEGRVPRRAADLMENP